MKVPLVAYSQADFLVLKKQMLQGCEGSVGFVPTMGGLHEGHLSLVRCASLANDFVVVSIFVNPLQFDDVSDFRRYPKTLEADLLLLAGEGVDLVFVPSVTDMYPLGTARVQVCAGEVGEVFEGFSRKGHFSGMLTVVAKLLSIVLPARCYFGQKDAQQLFLVRCMVADLNFGVEVVAVPIVRELSGLALSSRNRFLGVEDRVGALVLSEVLRSLVVVEVVEFGSVVWWDVVGLVDGFFDCWGRAQDLLDRVAGVEVDYFEVVDADSFRKLAVGGVVEHVALGEKVFVLLAARVGQVRLLDNVLLG